MTMVHGALKIYKGFKRICNKRKTKDTMILEDWFFRVALIHLYIRDWLLLYTVWIDIGICKQPWYLWDIEAARSFYMEVKRQILKAAFHLKSGQTSLPLRKDAEGELPVTFPCIKLPAMILIQPPPPATIQASNSIWSSLTLCLGFVPRVESGEAKMSNCFPVKTVTRTSMPNLI